MLNFMYGLAVEVDGACHGFFTLAFLLFLSRTTSRTFSFYVFFLERTRKQIKYNSHDFLVLQYSVAVSSINAK